MAVVCMVVFVVKYQSLKILLTSSIIGPNNTWTAVLRVVGVKNKYELRSWIHAINIMSVLALRQASFLSSVFHLLMGIIVLTFLYMIILRIAQKNDVLRIQDSHAFFY